MKTLLDMFPLASASTVAANPHLVAPNGGSGNKNDIQVKEPYWSEGKPKWNKTESEYALILEAQKRRGEILRYEFQGMTLRWGVDEKTGDSMRYTPDFVVFVLDKWSDSEQSKDQWHIKLIEVKGPHIHYRQQAIARFKGCRADWPEFQFECWQKQKGGEWKQIL